MPQTPPQTPPRTPRSGGITSPEGPGAAGAGPWLKTVTREGHLVEAGTAGLRTSRRVCPGASHGLLPSWHRSLKANLLKDKIFNWTSFPAL